MKSCRLSPFIYSKKKENEIFQTNTGMIEVMEVKVVKLTVITVRLCKFTLR